MINVIRTNVRRMETLTPTPWYFSSMTLDEQVINLSLLTFTIFLSYSRSVISLSIHSLEQSELSPLTNSLSESWPAVFTTIFLSLCVQGPVSVITTQ